MNNNTLIFAVIISILLGCFSCNNNPKQELSVDKEEIDAVSIKKLYLDSLLNILIDNFYKYKDENYLLEGTGWGIFPDDTLFIFNFEKGTITRVRISNPQTNKEDEDNSGYRTYGYANYIKGFPKDREITGDFNGDGKTELMEIDWEPIDKKFEKGELVYSEIDGFDFIFSDKKIPKLNVWGNCDYTIKNEGDLDGDGGDEIGFLYGWGVSACRTYTVFTLKNNKWQEMITIDSRKNMRKAGILPIEKDPEQEGVVLIRTPGYYGCCSGADYVVEIPVKITELQKFKKENLKYLIQR